MNRLILLPLILINVFSINAQYIAEVMEYVPAPGQLINASPWGVPSAAESIVGGIEGGLSLGAFGGYVVFRFGQPVENHPDNPYGVDFTLFGNASQSWSEPGIVWVMRDDNGNGMPDDTWYELKGSDRYFSSSITDYEVTYANPGLPYAADVPWTDNQGGEGVIGAISGHDQPYYPLPDSFPAAGGGQLTLSGSHVTAVVDSTLPVFIKSRVRAFGFADNRPRSNPPYTLPDNPYTPELENSGGDAFDLDWAVDAQCNYIDLDAVHFVKVQTAVQADGGWLGELSTEITGAVDVPPDPSISGIITMVVIKDLPFVLTSTTHPLEAYVFHGGRLQHDREILWSTNMPGATVDEDLLLTVTTSGELELTAQLADDPQVKATVTTVVDLSSSLIEWDPDIRKAYTYPNPASSGISFRGMGKKMCEVSVCNSTGVQVLSAKAYHDGDILDVSFLPAGLYIVQLMMEDGPIALKFIKR